ncbi:unnamed protein product [Allacma fusca]|uniref:Uncharacterized protein n=1 Tax=Allacma fusca TaxID=39272 RepID=A0A8J2JI89_9HEXA|nr:unnamed protein product [Allacma fusca]
MHLRREAPEAFERKNLHSPHSFFSLAIEGSPYSGLWSKKLFLTPAEEIFSQFVRYNEVFLDLLSCLNIFRAQQRF